MSRSTSSTRLIALASAVLIALAIAAAALGYPTLQTLSLAAPAPPALTKPASRSSTPTPEPRPTSPKDPTRGKVPARPAQPPGRASDPTVFDGGRSVTELDPELLSALRQAAMDADDDGVRFRVNSGWRSAAEQERLFRTAVRTYGSPAEAARWVARPGTSPHEAADAVDVGPAAAASWLARHGHRYGLCQIYGNEPWHYELRPAAVVQGCPTPYADPTHDPRMGR